MRDGPRPWAKDDGPGRSPRVGPVANQHEVGAELLRLLDQVVDGVELELHRHLGRGAARSIARDSTGNNVGP